jgi:methyl coenzyme M reductase alpha subunit
MRVVIVWKDYTDYAREVTDFLREFQRRTGKKLESVDPESRAGDSFARVYDIVQYPTIIAIATDGREQKRWAGLPLPLMDEVSFYTLGN